MLISLTGKYCSQIGTHFKFGKRNLNKHICLEE